MREYNFDGLVGPTHNYAGLARGNLASSRHEGRPANPREAALQGLAKMRFIFELGVGQAVLPPHPRPSLATLRGLGFSGSDEQVIARAAREDEHLIRLCSSAASMWAANACTCAPSEDTADGRLHITPANLQQMFHRAIEAETTYQVLSRIFADAKRFAVHRPLPGGGQFADEGAANHSRLSTPGHAAVHLFAWGRSTYREGISPRLFPARQTFEASTALARLHQLNPDRCVLAQQSPEGIDAGAFHNDVVAVANGAVLFCHEHAFVSRTALFASLQSSVGPTFTPIVVRESEVSLDRAVATYLFNSQLITRADGGMLLVAPAECLEDEAVAFYLRALVSGDGPIRELRAFDLRQSMNNGGGPACLRLRVVMSDAERAAVAANIWLDDELHAALAAWVQRHYRDRLTPADLADPALLVEGRQALDELSGLLRIGSVYPFQMA